MRIATLLILVCSTVRVGLADESLEIAGEILAHQQESIASALQGEMDFKVVESIMISPPKTYVGRVYWRFPKVRWEYEQSSPKKGGEIDSSRIVLIDDGKQFWRHVVTSKKLYVDLDHSRNYGEALKITPWQLWQRMDIDLTWEELLDVEAIQADPNRSIQFSKSGTSVIAKLVAIGEKEGLEMHFDATTGLIQRYDFLPRNADVGWKGISQWKDVDGHIFLKHMLRERIQPNNDRRVIHSIVYDFRNFAPKCSLAPEDFTGNSLETEDGTEVISFRNHKRVGTKWIGRKQASRESMLRELGAQAAEGFARER